MCGIVGYIGDRDIKPILLVGLERLSYRGYDSSGIAVLSEGEISCWKKPGKIFELDNMLQNHSLEGSVGIGHTRWATHGIPDEINAHPHLNENNGIAIVHNGIIENYATIKAELKQQGHIFRSETDSEVIVHLLEKHYESSLENTLEKIAPMLDGSFAVAAICEDDPGKIVVIRKGSPLIIGIGKNENFISSDINAILSHTKNVIYLEDDEIAVLTKTDVSFKKIGGKSIAKETQTIEWDLESSEKGGFDHFMLKEICEQPSVARRIISKYVKNGDIEFKHIDKTKIDLEQVSRFIIQACGTSWHAGLYGKYVLEEYAKVLTEVDISSEFRYRQMISTGLNDIVIAISQSGETADTLACIREAKSKFFKVLSLVNVKKSTIDRESDGVIYSHSGQEIGVASTKNFISQLISFYLLAVHLGQLKGTLTKNEAKKLLDDIKKIPEYIQSIIDQADTIKKIAEKYSFCSDFIFIGRGVNYPSSLEGALKLKEISYINASGYPAGELKHGPIALIDSKLPVVCLAPKTDTYEKMASNIQEVKSRKGKTIVIATEGDKEIAKYADDIIYIPKVPENLTPILIAIPLQLLSYYIAVKLDCDVDQPRNLAKSVTVE